MYSTIHNPAHLAAALFSALALVAGCGNPADLNDNGRSDGFRSALDRRQASASDADLPELAGGGLALATGQAWVIDDGGNSCNIFENDGVVKSYYKHRDFSDPGNDKWVLFGEGAYEITNGNVLTVSKSGAAFTYTYGVHGPSGDSLTIVSEDGFSVLFIKTGGVSTAVEDFSVDEGDPRAELILDDGRAWRYREGDRVFGVVFRANGDFVVVYYRGEVTYDDDRRARHDNGDWLIVGTGAWSVEEDSLSIATLGGEATAAYDVSGGYMVLRYDDEVEIYTELSGIAVSVGKARERKKNSMFFIDFDF